MFFDVRNCVRTIRNIRNDFHYKVFRAINVIVNQLNEGATMDIAYGTKIFNNETKEIGLLIKTWKNKFADGEMDYATYVDKKGKRYNTALDNISPIED